MKTFIPKLKATIKYCVMKFVWRSKIEKLDICRFCTELARPAISVRTFVDLETVDWSAVRRAVDQALQLQFGGKSEHVFRDKNLLTPFAGVGGNRERPVSTHLYHTYYQITGANWICTVAYLDKCSIFLFQKIHPNFLSGIINIRWPRCNLF